MAFCKIVSRNPDNTTYSCHKTPVVVKHCERKKYPLTPNQVYRVVNDYVKSPDTIVINDCSAGKIQGRVLINTKNGQKHLELYRPSSLALKVRKTSSKNSAVQTLMHEIAHLKGEMNEKKCDEYSQQEWKNANKKIKK